MKHRGFRFASPVLIVAAVGTICWVSAGDLNPPPGPIEPTMKTLDQIEPRTVIVPPAEGGTASAQRQPQPIYGPGIIGTSGSYYLGATFFGTSGQHGITITANDVTLDLNGFAMFGGPGSLDGINVPAPITGLVVRNGHVRNWGGDGVDASLASASRFENLGVIGNGADGLRAGNGSTFTNCTAQGNGISGIFANSGSTVTNCTAWLNTGTGIVTLSDSTVTNCTSSQNGVNGIFAGAGSTVTNCTSSQNGGNGIETPDGSTVTNCTAASNTGNGIEVGSASRVVGNTCDGNGIGGDDGAGIHATSSDNRIEGNNVTGNVRGLDIDADGNYIADNTVQGNTDNYDIVAGNKLNILLCQIPESIDWPAMVTLAGSLTGTPGQNGITVNAENVTIDLGGHALIGGDTDTLDGIFVALGDKVVANLTVRNGTLRHWGGDGVDAQSSNESQFENLRAIGNRAKGLWAGEGSTVTNCTAQSNTGDGIFANQGSTVTNCTARQNSGDGISAHGSTVTNCTASFNIGDGIEVSDDCYVVGNRCDNSGGDRAGIHVTGSDNRIEGNNVTDNPNRGIGVDSAGNIIIKNTASGNTTNYDIVAGNSFGPIVNVGSVGDISGTAGADHPWANFEY